MRILAIDHGTVRMGVAVSDELKMIALPLEVVPATPFKAFIARIREIIREKEVEQIIVGMPRNMNGTYGPSAEKVRQFIVVLKAAVAVPLVAWDERLTSAQANRVLDEANVSHEKRKHSIDMMAAGILLQSYLDSLGAV
jgi:putative Holliday junction resolvase